jgi:hypothetical protein
MDSMTLPFDSPDPFVDVLGLADDPASTDGAPPTGSAAGPDVGTAVGWGVASVAWPP